MEAAAGGHFEIVKTLGDAGAPTHDTDDKSRTAADYAMEYGHPEVASYLNATGHVGGDDVAGNKEATGSP